MSCKSFFTNCRYRLWAIKKFLALKCVTLPGIKHIIPWIYTYKFQKKTKNWSKWDTYVELKTMEANVKQACFYSALIRLQALIISGNPEKDLFERTKSDILNNEIIDDPQYEEFKNWLQSIDINEKDFSKIKEVVENLDKTSNE